MAMARWLRRRRRGLAGFVALEVVLTSVVVFITVNDNLFGGLHALRGERRPAARPRVSATPATSWRALPRVAELLGDLLRWAPFAVLAFVGAYLLIAAHRERLAVVVADHVHVEVAAAFAALVVGRPDRRRRPARPAPARRLVPDAPRSCRRCRSPPAWRPGACAATRAPAPALAAVTVALTVWMLAAAVLGDAPLAPPAGFGFA